ncbi:M81 family metallopeptidase [Paenibacillus spongiae]|uniref:M81 family metallopeptidase n=1 Tax=Paenibacillus spongiae TaxID=2909671 RepID=A0ABY5SH90_9BACL|nr:M81 family metallopeptidase [Paenibacillus spongiae]UVI33367.1 M81 family metallopeptidase [Paenibacillus spongiae]
MRIVVGGIMQESNSFSPKKTTVQDFRNYLYITGDELTESPFENEVKGFCDRLRFERAEIVPTLFCMAVPAGPISASGFEELKADLDIRLKEAKESGAVDGVLFAFHGAMVAEGCDDTEGELIDLIRHHIGEQTPLVITLDPHANVTARITGGVNGLVGYKTFPHIDFYETGQQAAELLLSILSKECEPVVAMRKIPMIVPAENGQFHSGPLGSVWEEAKLGEQRGESLVTSLFPVQPWLDIEEYGSAVVVVGRDRERAEREADRLAGLIWEKRHEFDVQLLSVDEVMELARRNQGSGEPVIISDSPDSPGAGSTGDSNAVLRRALELGVHHMLSGMLTMVDAPAVDAAIRAGVGSTVTLSVGYSLNPEGAPIEVTGKVRTIGDGEFVLVGAHAKNTIALMGRCVVLQIGGLSVLLQERAIFTGDPSMYRSVGLEPMKADFVMVKSANQFRAQYERLSSKIFILDTPGSSSAKLLDMPFRRIARPMYPFDDHFDWQ